MTLVDEICSLHKTSTVLVSEHISDVEISINGRTSYGVDLVIADIYNHGRPNSRRNRTLVAGNFTETNNGLNSLTSQSSQIRTALFRSSLYVRKVSKLSRDRRARILSLGLVSSDRYVMRTNPGDSFSFIDSLVSLFSSFPARVKDLVDLITHFDVEKREPERFRSSQGFHRKDYHERSYDGEDEYLMC